MCTFPNDSQFLSWLLSLSGPATGMFLPLQAASACCCGESLQAQLHCPQMNDSSHMRSMKCSVYIPAPRTCLMIQSHDKLATSSNKLSSPPRFLDVRSHVRSMPSTHKTGRSFLRVCTQKCDTWGDSSSGMSWIPPFASLPNEDSTVHTEAS